MTATSLEDSEAFCDICLLNYVCVWVPRDSASRLQNDWPTQTLNLYSFLARKQSKNREQTWGSFSTAVFKCEQSPRTGDSVHLVLRFLPARVRWGGVRWVEWVRWGRWGRDRVGWAGWGEVGYKALDWVGWWVGNLGLFIEANEGNI